MDDRQLIVKTQKLYQGIIDANIPTAQLRAVAMAIHSRTPWAALSSEVKLALMKMAVHGGESDGGAPDAPGDEAEGGGEPEAA